MTHLELMPMSLVVISVKSSLLEGSHSNAPIGDVMAKLACVCTLVTIGMDPPRGGRQCDTWKIRGLCSE